MRIFGGQQQQQQHDCPRKSFHIMQQQSSRCCCCSVMKQIPEWQACSFSLSLHLFRTCHPPPPPNAAAAAAGIESSALKRFVNLSAATLNNMSCIAFVSSSSRSAAPGLNTSCAALSSTTFAEREVLFYDTSSFTSRLFSCPDYCAHRACLPLSLISARIFPVFDTKLSELQLPLSSSSSRATPDF